MMIVTVSDGMRNLTWLGSSTFKTTTTMKTKIHMTAIAALIASFALGSCAGPAVRHEIREDRRDDRQNTRADRRDDRQDRRDYRTGSY